MSDSAQYRRRGTVTALLYDGAMLAWFSGAIMAGYDHNRLPDGARERVAGRLSTEPPYSDQHPETLVPLADALLDAAFDRDPVSDSPVPA